MSGVGVCDCGDPYLRYCMVTCSGSRLGCLMSLVPCQAQRVGEVTGQSSRVKACCLKLALLLRSRGRFPWWGDLLIPRYQGPPGRLSRGAGRPMGPSTPRCFFLKAVLFFARLLNQPLELNQDESKDIALRISRIRSVGPSSVSPCLASVWFFFFFFRGSPWVGGVHRHNDFLSTTLHA